MRDFPLGKGSVRWSRLLPLATGLAVMTAGSAALACPDWQQTGQQIRYSADQLWTPQSLSVVAGGASNLANCPQPGVGYVAARPDFDLTLTDNGARRDLVIRVTASCDAVLLVNGADGQWSFNDDSDGVNPRLQLPDARPGVYDIWVGTYSPTPCQATLTLETLGGTQMPQPQPQPVVPQPQVTVGGGLTWRFDRDTQGWQVRDGQLSTVPGSHMQVTAWGDSRVGYLIAPPSALGDWRGVTAIDAVMRSPGSRYFAAFSEGAVGDLVLYNGTMSAAAAFPHWLGPDWAQLSVPLRQAVTMGGTLRWQLGGGAGSLEQVLANVTAFHVRGEFQLGDTIADVREIALQGVIGPSAIAVPQPQPQPQPVAGVPAAAGLWRINGNSYAGTLTLTWSGAGWAGVVNYDVYRRDEPLENIRFDPASGSIEFTRPIPGATQIYRGRLAGGEMRGEFNQAGGAYSYGWSATLSAPQAGGGAAPAPGGGTK